MKRRTLGPMTLAGALVGALTIVGTAGAASPVQGSISGPITSVKGKTFTVKTPANLGVPKNLSKVEIVSSTTITEQATGTRASVKKGVCATAIGTKNKKGVVTAQRVSLRPAVKGSCTNGFQGAGAGAGRRPPTGTNPNRPSGGNGTGQRPPGANGGFSRNANFGFASGLVTHVKGKTISVKGQTGTATFVLAKTTQIDRTLTVGAKRVKTKLCAFVNGTSADKGATVKAERITLSKPAQNGCFGGFRGGRRGAPTP